ncbi:DUF4386 domain-containing protein [Spirochaeta isovalerica]|uniref:DUF4386 domain-containing protein n=1 Tax=Spirochaeta isovalerica TaxID=150 RepID=A0A841RCQ5_9SPIO|nr:DUF4386 domain-containing protein [Spirochaeta isovalerica]MBB6481775.1 hypothetical protein [Spirochaeta isovalerica]
MDTVSSGKKTARIAGLFYLLYISASIISEAMGHFVFEEAGETVEYLIGHGTAFRAGILVALFSGVLFLIAAWALNVLLSKINREAALLLFLLNLAGFVIWCISLSHLFSAADLLSGAYSEVFTPEELKAQAMVFINSRKTGAAIAQIPYSLWLLPLGYLIYKSDFIPRIFGVFLFADAVGLLLYLSQELVFPFCNLISYPSFLISFIAEVSLACWLLLIGVKKGDPESALITR